MPKQSPTDPTDALIRSATEFHTQGNLAEAIRCYLAVLAVKPVYPPIHYNLGVALFGQGRLHDAIEHFQTAIRQKPDYAAAYCNLGIVYKSSGNTAAAIAAYREAIRLQPEMADAHSNLGNALYAIGDLQEAATHCRKAIALNPAHAQACNNLGNVLKALHDHAGALRSYRRALQLKPDHPEAHANLGHLLLEQGATGKVIACYERALQLNPGFAEAQSNLFYLLLNRCNWNDFAAWQQKISTAVARQTKGYAPLPFLAVSGSAKLQLLCAQTHVAHNHPPLAPPLASVPPPALSRIRVAYLSGDFRDHALSYLTAGLFALHDRKHFEVTGISLTAATGSEMERRVRTGFDRFIDAADKTDSEIAGLVQALAIDILVDLMGFTRGCRPNVLARRPAPIQINYLGFPATMGASYIDYILADRYVIPPQLQHCYAEKVVWLPDCFQVNDSARSLPVSLPARSQHNLPESGIVFCCFNNSCKISPLIFDCWMRVLARTPASVLWLVADDECVEMALRKEAAKRHVDPARLVFAARVPYADYLQRFQLADLFLDTLPFNAGTTASDALWSGVPIVTCPGEAFASRMAGSLLTACGLPELIADDLAAYEELACSLAADPDRLRRYRDHLAQQRRSGPLFDTQRFCRQLESAFITMVERHWQGLPAASFEVVDPDR